MPAKIYHFNQNQGEDLRFTLTVTRDESGSPVPVPVSAFRMDVKKAVTDALPLYSFNSTGLSIIVDPDGSESGVPSDDDLVDATISAHIVTVTINRAFTFIPAVVDGGKFLYDAFIEFSDGTRAKVLTGTINVNASVTRWSE